MQQKKKLFHTSVYNKNLSKNRLTNDHGHIHDGAGNYSVGVKCSWLIDARDLNGRGGFNSGAQSTTTALSTTNGGSGGGDKPKSIRLHLEEFATECGWDHLYVYDGDSVESPLLAVFRSMNLQISLLILFYLFTYTRARAYTHA